MNRFLADLSRFPVLGGPSAWATARWPSFAYLTDKGLLQRVPALEDEPWPCDAPAHGGCSRELTREGETWLAVCTCGSPWAAEPEEVEPERVRLLERRWVAFVARACGLEAAPEPTDLTVLGERQEGRHTVLYLWVRHLPSLAPATLALLVEDRRPDAVVALVPSRRLLQQVVPSRLRGSRLVWLALDEVFDVETERVDLADLRVRFGIGGLDLLWPRYQLALDDTTALWCGVSHDLGRAPARLDLLRELGRDPGAFVARSDLLPRLFPDEFTNRGRARTDLVKLDRRLRQLVSRLTAQLGPGPDGAPLVENLRGRSDTDGGYRLALAPDRFFDLLGDRP